jgi:hypothetical protein
VYIYWEISSLLETRFVRMFQIVRTNKKKHAKFAIFVDTGGIVDHHCLNFLLIILMIIFRFVTLRLV